MSVRPNTIRLGRRPAGQQCVSILAIREVERLTCAHTGQRRGVICGLLHLHRGCAPIMQNRQDDRRHSYHDDRSAGKVEQCCTDRGSHFELRPRQGWEHSVTNESNRDSPDGSRFEVNFYAILAFLSHSSGTVSNLAVQITGCGKLGQTFIRIPSTTHKATKSIASNLPVDRGTRQGGDFKSLSFKVPFTEKRCNKLV